MSWMTHANQHFVKEKSGYFENKLWHCVVANHSATICHRMSPTPKSTGKWVILVQNLGRKGSAYVSQIFTWSARYIGAVVCKRNCVDFCRSSTIYECDKQTDHGTVTSIPIDEIDFQRCRLIINNIFLLWLIGIFSVAAQNSVERSSVWPASMFSLYRSPSER